MNSNLIVSPYLSRILAKEQIPLYLSRRSDSGASVTKNQKSIYSPPPETHYPLKQKYLYFLL